MASQTSLCNWPMWSSKNEKFVLEMAWYLGKICRTHLKSHLNFQFKGPKSPDIAQSITIKTGRIHRDVDSSNATELVELKTCIANVKSLNV